MYNGEVKQFDDNWKARSEAHYLHWTRGPVQNQIQFAFRNHWEVFSEILDNSAGYNSGKRVLEVGCGRGSLSAYFSEAGYNCSLLDLSSEAVKIAQQAFEENNLQGNFFVGDAEALEFQDNSFDILFSIGLLEHFEHLDNVIKEQIRVLDTGGLWLGYIVPEYKDNVQRDYRWINELLKQYTSLTDTQQPKKEEIYRSDYNSNRYVPVLESFGLKIEGISGIYSTPMISHSIDFPFSLMPEAAEASLLKHFEEIFESRRKHNPHQHPWLCAEGEGNAFLIWGVKV